VADPLVDDDPTEGEGEGAAGAELDEVGAGDGEVGAGELEGDVAVDGVAVGVGDGVGLGVGDGLGDGLGDGGRGGGTRTGDGAGAGGGAGAGAAGLLSSSMEDRSSRTVLLLSWRAPFTRASSSPAAFASLTRNADWASRAFISPESRASSFAFVSWPLRSSSTWLRSVAISLSRRARSPLAHPLAAATTPTVSTVARSARRTPPRSPIRLTGRP